jgi:hypothetical protein
VLKQVPHNLFHGVSVAMCDVTEEEILSLMKDGDATRARLGEAVSRLMQAAKDDAMRASWKRCRPSSTNLHSAHRDKEGRCLLPLASACCMLPLAAA